MLAQALPRAVRSSLAWVGIGLLGLIVLTAVLAPVLSPWDPTALAGAPFEPPGPDHPLGTDDIGHDILSVLLHGARVSLGFGLAAAFLAMSIGTLVGIYAGYAGGRSDVVLMRLVDIVLVLPFLPLILVIGAFFGPGILTEIAVITAVMWARPARELRAQVLGLRQAAYIQASAAMGASRGHILLRHVLPGVIPVVIPLFVEVAKNAVLAEASLSFLGLGDPTVISWGTLLYHANARGALLTPAWLWWVLPPGLALGVTILALALTGLTLEDVVRPRLATLASTFTSIRHGMHAPAVEPDATSAAGLLRCEHISIAYDSPDAMVLAVDDVSIGLMPGETLALVGESGSGKTSLANAVLRMLPGSAHVTSGRITFDGHDVLGLDAVAMRALRGRRIASVPQSAMNSLNPVRRIGSQLIETIELHSDVRGNATNARAIELLADVDLDARVMRQFPHELSGGMRQRVVIAMALTHRPALIIADEPTTGLDVMAQVELIALLRRLKQEHDTAWLLITHDIAFALGTADRVAVMREGRIVESAAVGEIARAADHPYTRRLLASVPDPDATETAGDGDPAQRYTTEGAALLRLEQIRKSYPVRGVADAVVLVDLSLAVQQGRITGLVGRSGAGKSTLARILFGLEAPETGRASFDGTDLIDTRGPERRAARARLHFIFQDAYEALPPHWRVHDIVAEPLRIRGDRNHGLIRDAVLSALQDVSLRPAAEYASRRPHEISGGERQRVALARALVTRPAMIVADEPTSLLDAPQRVDLLDLLRRLCDEHRITVLYITHDLALAGAYCDRIAILADGRIVEEGPARRILAAPTHPRSAELIQAMHALHRPRQV